MSDPFYGEIRMFAGTYAPRNWAFCNGQLAPVNSNQALFSLLGTIYGGDGYTTFSLPDMRGRVPMHYGTGIALSPRTIGYRIGMEYITLTKNQLPAHNHSIIASPETANSVDPTGKILATPPVDANLTPESINFYSEYDQQSDLKMNDAAFQKTGSDQSHLNVMPYLCINYIISLAGAYPQRT